MPVSTSSNGNGVAAAQSLPFTTEPSPAYNLEKNDWTTSSLSVVVLGASGDLAKKKIFPALFALFYEGLLPPGVQIFGYARSKMTDDEFRNMINATLTCRIDARYELVQSLVDTLVHQICLVGSYAVEVCISAQQVLFPLTDIMLTCGC